MADEEIVFTPKDFLEMKNSITDLIQAVTVMGTNMRTMSEQIMVINQEITGINFRLGALETSRSRNRSRVNSRGGRNYACAKPAAVLVAKTPVSVLNVPQTPFVIDEQCDSGDEDEERFPKVQIQDLNFIVEGCVFRGDLEIPTPPPSDAEQRDALTDYDGRAWEDVRTPSPDDDSRRQWECDVDIDSRSYIPVGWNNKPSSPPHEHFIPSAAFTRSAVEERSNTPPDEFDRYLTESFRPVNKPLLPATTTPARDVAAPKAATTGDACAARAAPSVDIVPRRLSYSDVSAIRRAHGERDPDLGAVSDADSRCDDDYGVIPGDWQDQSLYDTELLQHVDASHSPFSSHGGQDSDASSSCGLKPNRDDYSDTSSVQSDHYDSDGRSDVSADCYNEYGDY